MNRMNRGTPFGNDRGMALVEVLFALTVLVATLSLLVGSLISFNRLASVTEQRERAVVRMSSFLEGLRQAEPVEVVAGTFQPPVTPESGETWQVECRTADGNYHAIPIDTGALTSPVSSPLTIRVSLTRKDARGVPVRVTSGVICQH